MEESKKEQLRQNSKRWRATNKLKVLYHYSDGNLKCNCCGEAHFEFLTIDHIDNSGKDHRRKLAKSYDYRKISAGEVYRDIIKKNYPDGFQVLCYNCNCSKGIHGECPHTVGGYDL
jgi:hypothetical protein